MSAKTSKTRQAETGERPDKTSATAKPNGCYAKKAPSRATHLQPHRVQPGQVLNPKGRPLGSRNRLAESFIETLQAVWKERGREIIDKTIEQNPAALISAIARLVPKDFQVTVSGAVQISHDLTIEQRRKIAESWMLSQQSAGPSAIEGTVIRDQRSDALRRQA